MLFLIIVDQLFLDSVPFALRCPYSISVIRQHLTGDRHGDDDYGLSTGRALQRVLVGLESIDASPAEAFHAPRTYVVLGDAEPADRALVEVPDSVELGTGESA